MHRTPFFIQWIQVLQIDNYLLPMNLTPLLQTETKQIHPSWKVKQSLKHC